MRLNKKALTQTVIILLIIAILSLVVVAYAWANNVPNLQGGIDKEACRDSVKARGAAAFAVHNVVMDKFPLQCETINVCIYVNDKNCLSFKDYDKSKIGYIQVKNKDEVLKALADKIAESHWILDEGNSLYVPVTSNREYYCSLTHRISFSDELKNEGAIPLALLYTFMLKNKPNIEDYANYWEYLIKYIYREEYDISIALPSRYYALEDLGYYKFFPDISEKREYEENIDFNKNYVIVSVTVRAAAGESLIDMVTDVGLSGDSVYFFPDIYEEDADEIQKLKCTSFPIASQ